MVVESFINGDSYGLLKILANWKMKVTSAISLIVLETYKRPASVK